MAASKDMAETPPTRPADQDVDFAGYDPYIVAITAVDHADTRRNVANEPAETLESRKAKLMTWLRENGAQGKLR
ncbi:MAG: hypothetical protein JNK40_09515 [Chromatiales bacterium]|nr:hypothetical protein [Chromatiales bacterium]